MRWFTVIRHIVVFLLGVLIIVDGLVSPTNAIPKLIIGMVMVGVLPIESFRLIRSNQQTIDARPICDIEHRQEAPE